VPRGAKLETQGPSLGRYVPSELVLQESSPKPYPGGHGFLGTEPAKAPATLSPLQKVPAPLDMSTYWHRLAPLMTGATIDVEALQLP
jgi:hypothetical protein